MTAELLERPVSDLVPLLGSLPVPELDHTHVGITGTRTHMGDWQRAAFSQLIYAFRPVTPGWTTFAHPRNKVEMHHGCCQGADTDAHYLGAKYSYDVTLHPAEGVDEWQNMTLMPVGRGMAYWPVSTKERNEAIVNISDVLLAAPRYAEEDYRAKRSGTWQTIRMAREEKLPIYYAMPDGQLFVENK